MYLDTINYNPVNPVNIANVNNAAANKSFWNAVQSNNPNFFNSIWQNQTLDNVIKLLRDSTLSANAKFKKIFGFEPTAANVTLKGLGSIFDDIGSFFSNLFSSSNINNSIDFFRQGAVQYSNAANVLQYSQNQPNPQTIAQQQTAAFNLQQNASNTLTSFVSAYGVPLVIGGAILLILALKK